MVELACEGSCGKGNKNTQVGRGSFVDGGTWGGYLRELVSESRREYFKDQQRSNWRVRKDEALGVLEEENSSDKLWRQTQWERVLRPRVVGLPMWKRTG
jgi:hypothetical protein